MMALAGAGLLAMALLAATPALADPVPAASARAAEPEASGPSAAMAAMADELIAGWRSDDRAAYLDTLFRLQMAAGRWSEAAASLQALEDLEPDAFASTQARATSQLYAIYAQARVRSGASGEPLEAALAASFRARFADLDDRTAALAIRALGVDLASVHDSLTSAAQAVRAIDRPATAQAMALARAWQIDEALTALVAAAPALIAEDDARRYEISRDVRITTPDGATVCALIVRPRGAGPLPALLNFTIYNDPPNLMAEARRSASHGYVGVEALSRGKGCSPDTPVPYEHDGADAAATIDWIAGQSWSDGQVGMFGGSYEGFTQWAAAKHHPKALKAMMPSVSAAPAIDVPREGGIALSFVYYWPFYAANGKGLDEAAMNDRARWNRMRDAWYVSGRAYRDLDKIDGVPNPYFDRWLEHPDYDAYWQAMIPFGKEFADIDIPVLTTTGYYDDAQIGALYYFREHTRRRPKAEHYLLIGPYDHIRGQRGTYGRLGGAQTNLRGYETDPAALLDLGELRYQWFDHVLKKGPRPALLTDRVNYEVMGADLWKHAPSLDAMGPRRLRLYLDPATMGDGHSLSAAAPAKGASTLQTLDMTDRSDVDRTWTRDGLVDPDLDPWNGVVFSSAPLPGGTELSGLFSGRLALVTNKRDFDIDIQLYEQRADGTYQDLSHWMTRASYAGDLTRRRLLKPGRRQVIEFTAGRLTSRRFEAGSRLVAVITVLRGPGAQINYGSGKPVSDETVKDAGAPLRIEWLGESWIEVPTGG